MLGNTALCINKIMEIQTSTPHSSVRRILTLTVLTLLVAATAATVVYFFEDKGLFAKSQGYILLNLAEGEEIIVYPYFFDVAKKEFLPTGKGIGFTPSSPVGRAEIVSSIDSLDMPRGVYARDIASRATSLIAPSASRQPWLPQLSSDGLKVAFAEPPALEEERLATSRWSIYIADRGGIPRKVAFGTDPHWAPDGASLLYLGDTGLKLLDLAKGESTDVWSLESGTTTFRMRIDVSDDGKKLAWGNPAKGEIVLATLFRGLLSWRILESVSTLTPFGPPSLLMEESLRMKKWRGERKYHNHVLSFSTPKQAPQKQPPTFLLITSRCFL